MDEDSKPYFVLSGDHPNLVLVTTPLIGIRNYDSWRRSMQLALNSKNKAGFVDGSLPQPLSDDPLAGAWSRCNSLVTSWIINAVAPDIADGLFYLDTARDVWLHLHSLFHQSRFPRVFQIRKHFHELRQGSLSINAYCARVSMVWKELKKLQPNPLELQQQECVMQLLIGLDESYADVRRQILMLDPLPDMAKVFCLLVQEESRRATAYPSPSVPHRRPAIHMRGGTESVPARGPAFCKIIMSSTATELCIPPAFIRKYGEFFPEKVSLNTNDGSGKSWDVKIEKIDGDYWLTQGWQSFMKDNKIGFPDCLVFQFVLNSMIQVGIFDKNGCDRDAASEPECPGGMGTQRKRRCIKEGLDAFPAQTKKRAIVRARIGPQANTRSSASRGKIICTNI